MNAELKLGLFFEMYKYTNLKYFSSFSRLYFALRIITYFFLRVGIWYVRNKIPP